MFVGQGVCEDEMGCGGMENCGAFLINYSNPKAIKTEICYQPLPLHFTKYYILQLSTTASTPGTVYRHMMPGFALKLRSPLRSPACSDYTKEKVLLFSLVILVFFIF